MFSNFHVARIVFYDELHDPMSLIDIDCSGAAAVMYHFRRIL